MPQNKHKARSTALITGGSVGIGLELARQFATHGHDLVLVARNRDALEAAAGTLEGRYGIRVTVIPSDLADPESPQRLYDAILEQGIDIEYLVNNAGFGLGGEFADTDLNTELDMIQVNIASVVHLTKLFMQPMLKRKSGGVLNVASVGAFQPGPLISVYYASKAFVLSFSEAIAEELRNSGVTVTCLCPGPTATNFADTAGIRNSRLMTQLQVENAEDVARIGYSALMKGDRIALTTMRNRVMVLSERFAPRTLVTKLSRMTQENR